MRRFAWLLMLLTAAPAAAEPFSPKLLKEFGTSRFRYPGTAISSTVSPDGAYLAINGTVGVHVFELATGRNIFSSLASDSTEDREWFSRPVFDRFNYLHVLEYNRDLWPRIAIFRIPSGERLHTTRVKAMKIRGSNFSPDGTLLAIWRSGEAILYDGLTGQELYRLGKAGRDEPEIGGVQFSPDGRRLAVLFDKEVRVFDRTTGAVLGVVDQVDERCETAFTRDSERFCLLIANRTILTLDFRTGSRVSLNCSGHELIALPNDRIGCLDQVSGTCKFVDLRTNTVAKNVRVAPFDRTIVMHKGNGTVIYGYPKKESAVTPDGRTLVQTGTGEILLWDLETGRQLPISYDGAGIARRFRWQGPDRLLADRSGDHPIGWTRCDFLTGRETRLVSDLVGESLDVTPDGSLQVVKNDRSISIVETSSGRKPFLDLKWAGSIWSTGQFINAGDAVAIWDESEMIIWRFRENAVSRAPFPEGEKYYRGTLSPRSRWFASHPTAKGTRDIDTEQFVVRGLHSGQLVARFRNENEIKEIGFSTDDAKLIYATGHDSSPDHPRSYFHVVDPVTGTLHRRVSMPSSSLDAISPDGRVLLTKTDGFPHRVIAVELASGALRWELPSAKPWMIHGVGCAPDLRRIAVGTSDGLVRIWDTAPDDGATPPDAAAWDDLRDADAAKGYAAIRRFAKYPAVALSLLKAKLPPEPKTDPAAVAGWLRDLGAPAFRTREAATRNLAATRATARTAMEATLATTPSPEVRERLTGLLERPAKPLTDEVRAIRAAEIIERILADERTAKEIRQTAIELLKRWADGADGATLTTEATETLNRMKR